MNQISSLTFMELSPTQEHFLKKQLLQLQLQREFSSLGRPEALRAFGDPFNSHDYEGGSNRDQFPLLAFFLNCYITSFPLLSHNQDPHKFWGQTVQSFVESLNSKSISSSVERQESSKRKKISNKMIKLLVLYFNSTIITKKDLLYLESDHLKSGTDLDKIAPPGSATTIAGSDKTVFQNSLNINIVAVRHVSVTKQTPYSFFSSGNETFYEFIICLKRLDDAEERPSIFVARRYRDFHRLDSVLRKAFPGVKLPTFPSKTKITSSIDQLSSQAEVDDGGLINSISTIPSTTKSPKNRSRSTKLINKIKHKSSYLNLSSPGSPELFKLPREKLRLLLRGYLNGLIEISEVATNELFLDFLTKDCFSELSAAESKDSDIREHNDEAMKLNELHFQEEAQSSVLQLKTDLEDFKSNLVTTDGALQDIFNEIGTCTEISQLSPLLISFIHWSKIQIAATVYTLFLGRDNASESFKQLKKLHSIFPYSVMYQILKFTNPMFMMQKIMDLLLANLPFTNTCLLQYIFTLLLNDDLKNVEEELKELRDKIGIRYNDFCAKIDNYTAHSDEAFIDKIGSKAISEKDDLLLTIFKSEQLAPALRENQLNEVIQSHESYLWVKEQTREKADLEKIASNELYSNLRNYWLLTLRKKDKDIMKVLWSEPELVGLLQEILTTFYEPLIKIFKASKMHIAFKNFENFMNDLIKKIEYLDANIYILSPAKITSSILETLDQHQNSLFDFIHNLYANDKENIFSELILWLEKFLKALRLKNSNPDSVTIDLANVIAFSKVDNRAMLSELNTLVEKTLLKRKIYNEIIQRRADNNHDNGNPEKKWDALNNQITTTFKGEDFGLSSNDINELNFNFEDFDVSTISKELQDYVKEIDHIDEQLDSFSEISKLQNQFAKELSRVLGGIYV